MKRILLWTLAAILALAGLAWGLDDLSLVLLIPNRPQFDFVKVDQLYAIPNKWNEVDWSRGNPVTERCVNSALPHFGSRPCWYVKSHTMHVNEL